MPKKTSCLFKYEKSQPTLLHCLHYYLTVQVGLGMRRKLRIVYFRSESRSYRPFARPGHMVQNYVCTGEQVAQWDLQNNAPAFVLASSWCSLFPSAKCWPLLLVIKACRWRWPVFVAGISARFSFFFFCYGANHLMNGPEGNSEFCFLPHWLP